MAFRDHITNIFNHLSTISESSLRREIYKLLKNEFGYFRLILKFCLLGIFLFVGKHEKHTIILN